MHSKYILASDFGIGSCKTVLVDTDGLVVATASSEYPMHLPQPGWFEQDPQDWLIALGKTVRAVLDKSNISPSSIVAIGLDGVTHNVVLLDEHGDPLRPCITFYDTRSAPESEEINRKWGQTIFQRTCNSVSPVWTWPQLLWIKRHEADVWAKTRKILCQKDYIRNYIVPSLVTDLIDAEGTLLFDPFKNVWIEDFIRDLGIPATLLPEVVAPTTMVGRIDRKGAELTGLQLGTPVVAGTTDTVAEVLGAGAIRPGHGTVKLASVGRITSVSTTPTNHPQLLNYRHVIDDLWYPGTATRFAASSFRWLRDSVWNGAAYDEMGVAAANAPPGCKGLLFHPHLEGEWVPYWDDNLRGDFLGLTMRHSREHLTRAVMEGVAFALRAGLEFATSFGLSFTDIRLIGQGGRSHIWKQIIADTLNRKMIIPSETDAAFGAALVTGMGAGFFPSTTEQISRYIRVKDEIIPQPEEVEIYNSLFEIYMQSDAVLKSISHSLTEFEYQRPEKESTPLIQEMMLSNQSEETQHFTPPSVS
jgi:xylulokinase